MSTETAPFMRSALGRLGRGALAGIGAGIVFAVVTMWFADSMGDPWRAPLHMISTIVYGDDAMMEGTTNATVGAIVHLILSAAFGAGLALVLPWLRLRTNGGTVVAATVFGVALYVVNFEILAPTVFTTFDGANKPFELFAHVVFGSLLGMGLLHHEVEVRHRVAAA